MAGGILGGMLIGAGCASACLGVDFLLIGAGIAVGMAANVLGEKARDACVEAGASSMSPCGTIITGSGNVFINGKAAAFATLSTVACDKDKAQLVDKVAIRLPPFPATLELQVPAVPQAKKYPAGIVCVNFEQAGITQATRTLPFFPEVGPEAVGEKTVVIDLDVSTQGKPPGAGGLQNSWLATYSG